MKKKTIPVCHKSGYESTVMPKYNPFQTGHGVVGDTKYNRNKSKSQARKEMRGYLD